MKSQFRTPTGSHCYLLAHRGKYHIEAKRDPRRGDFSITVNKRIVDRQRKPRETILSFKFWVANCDGYKSVYFIPQKEERII